MQAIRLNEHTMHFRVDGPADGPVVFFSNSLGTDLRVWDQMLDHLPAGLRIIRYDKRGHGLSEELPAPYFMGDLVSDAAALLDHLGARNVLMVGLSIGGIIAQGLAAERPNLLNGMVLMDTAAKIGTPEMWEDRAASIRNGGLKSISSSVMERWFSKELLENRPDELAKWTAMLTRTPLEGYVGCCQAIAETDLRDSTAKLSLPTMALAGAEDGATPPDLVRETAELVKGSSFHVIRGTGHLPCVEKPLETASLITRFMEEIGHV